MKKLNITKKQYDESKYFNKKYGALKYVSESGKFFKTDKGVVLALEGTESQGAESSEGDGQTTDESLKDIGNAIKDTAKDIGGKIKDGAKKAVKAVGDAIKGPFRSGDQVEMSNDQGDTCTATIVDGELGGKKYTVLLQRKMAAEAEGDEGADAEVTRGELTDILKDVVSEVEKVCDSQDISFEEVAGIETPEGEADETADADEVVATKEDVADALQGVIDAVEKVADANDIELPEEEEDEEGAASDDDDGEEQYDEGCDCGKKDCPECNPDGVQGECGGQACECGSKVMESRRARAKLVREAIARRARARKIRESRERRAKVRKVLESIRRRRAAKKVLESIRRRRAAKKLMESRKPEFKKIRTKRVMESRRIRARKAGMAK
jgi:hypothetical protein